MEYCYYDDDDDDYQQYLDMYQYDPEQYYSEGFEQGYEWVSAIQYVNKSQKVFMSHGSCSVEPLKMF